jgi:trigger factor
LTEGTEIVFTAEVDVRPEFDLPEYKGLAVEVADVQVTEADINEQLDELRGRFSRR